VEIEVACVTSPCQQEASSQVVIINQGQNAGRWQPVGAVDITHGPAEVQVRVTRPSSQRGWIVCDAARLLRISSVATLGGESLGERVGPLEVRELMHPRIDVDAQRAIRRMSQGDEAASTDANDMFEAVTNGQLAGIFAVNQRVPALRANRMGIGWWQLIPEGQDSAVVLEPGQPTSPPPVGDQAPLIAFRDAVRKEPPRLEAALRNAWASFRLLRSGELRSCEPEGAVLTASVAEAGPTPALIPLANIVPVLCQLRPTPPQPRPPAPPGRRPPSRPSATASLRSGTFIEILQGGGSIRVPTLPHAGLFDISIGTIVVGGVNLVARLPRGGDWQIGVVQNVVVHQGSLLYRLGTVRWFSGAPLLDVLDRATDIWGPPPPTPIPIGGADLTIPNPVTVTANAGDGSAGPFNIALADTARISVRGTGECGPLIRGSVVVMFEAGIAARQGKTLVWLATSKQPYGFVVGVEVDANGSAAFTTTAIGKRGEIIASPPGNPLVTGPPTANQFTRTVVRRAFNRAFVACAASS